MSVLIDIKNMQCAYGKKQVLSVEDMNFKRGKLYFLLGKSGVGKSTFLEAIGMMSDTISQTSEKVNYCID